MPQTSSSTQFHKTHALVSEVCESIFPDPLSDTVTPKQSNWLTFFSKHILHGLIEDNDFLQVTFVRRTLFHSTLHQRYAVFLLMPLAVEWVNRWTFSSPPPSPSSHHQLFVYLRYRKCCGVWVFRCDAILFYNPKNHIKWFIYINIYTRWSFKTWNQPPKRI